MYRLIDEIQRLRTYPTEDELNLIKEVIEAIKESDECRLMVEIADGDGNISVQSVRDLVYGAGK